MAVSVCFRCTLASVLLETDYPAHQVRQLWASTVCVAGTGQSSFCISHLSVPSQIPPTGSNNMAFEIRDGRQTPWDHTSRAFPGAWGTTVFGEYHDGKGMAA